MGETDVLKGAVVGYGFIASLGHVPAYLKRPHKDVEIIAVADVCEARRAAAHKVLPTARIYSDAKSLLVAESGRLDFVDICTPPSAHAEIAHLALNSGLHVLCEKPLTTTLDEARSLLAHAKEVGRVIFPCHNYKHAPVVRAIRKILESGEIGQVRSVTLNTFRNTHAKGVPEWNSDWRRERRWSGGGIGMDHGSHSFYLTFDWLEEYPVAVTAKTSSYDTSYDTEDNFTATLTFPSGMAHVYLTWTAGVRKVIYTIQGEKGAIIVDDDDLQIAVMHEPLLFGEANGEAKHNNIQGNHGYNSITWEVEKCSIASDWMDASHVAWFNAMFDQFKTAILNKDFVGKEALEAYLCIQLITKAYQSAQEGCRELPLG